MSTTDPATHDPARQMTNTEHWQRDGYLILRNQLESAMIDRLRDGCDASLQQWQRESTPEGEPGGHCYGPSSWVMLHLNHPKYHHQPPQSRATLLNAVADPRVLSALDDIFREPAVLCQINYYIDPSESRPASWHRDSQFFAQSREHEAELIARECDPPGEIHMHIPLVPTSLSEIVPGSHARTDTEEESRIRDQAPTSDLPGALRLELEPGDLAFFHVNALHRGGYPAGVTRRTIAVTFARASHRRVATAESMVQRTGYVATYQPWLLKPDYLEGCRPAAREFYERTIDVYRDSWKRDYLQPLHPELQRYFNEY